jgi:hypothetical protein
MERKIKIISVICGLILLNNCTNIDKYSQHDFGNPKGFKEDVKRHILSYAKNPPSIKFNFITEPEKILIQNTSLSGIYKPFYTGYGLCVNYSGTNSYGGTVTHTEKYLLRNDGVILGDDHPTMEKYNPCIKKTNNP